MAKREVFVSLNIQTEGDERLTEIVRRQRELKEENKATQKSYKELAAQLKDQTITLEQYNTSLKLNDASIARNRIELKALSGIEREATNDLSGLTEAGLRFRDKMADATVEALKQSGAIGQLAARMDFLRTEQDRLNAEQREGKMTAEEYRAAIERTENELRELGTQAKSIDTRIEALTKEFKEGKITAEQYKASVNQLGNEMKGVGDAVNKGVADLKNYALGFIGVTALIQGAGAALKSIGTTVADFQQANTNLAAILGTTRDKITELTDSALKIGPAFGRAPEEVTNLQTELAKLGFTVPEILAAQEAVISLANATGEELGKSAEIAAATLNGFNLQATDTARVVDVIAQAANASSLDLEKFSTAMATVAPAAVQAGMSIEETTALVGILADRGLDASTVGTSLRSMFIDLSRTGKTLDEALAEINGSTNKTNTAFELFGERAAGAAVILAEATGETRDLENALNDAGGAAQKVADEQLNTLSGSVEKVSASWDALVLSFDKGDGTLSKFIQGAINGFAEWLAQLKEVEGFGGFLDKFSDAFSLSGGAMIEFDAQMAKVREGQAKLTEETDTYTNSLEFLQKELKKAADIQQKNIADGDFAAAGVNQEQIDGILEKIAAKKKEADQAKETAKVTVDALDAEGKALDKDTLKKGKNTEATKVVADSVAYYQEEIRKVQDLQAQSTSAAQFQVYQAQIDALNTSIELLKGQIVELPEIETVQFVADENTDAPEPPELHPTEEELAEKEARIRESEERAADIIAEIRDRGLSDQERLTAELAAIDAEYQAGRIESEEEYQALKADVAQREEELKAATIDATLSASADLFTALSEMAEEGSEEQKAFAVTAALINTYQGVTKALATLPPPASYIAAATTLVQGLQAVAKIQGFAVGGYTGDGARHEPAGIVHRGEYVFSKPAVERIGVDKLEAMHTDATGRSSPQVRPMEDLSRWIGRAQGQLMMAPFLEGGPVTTSLSLPRPTADQLVAAEIAVSLRNINLRPQVDVNTIRSAMSNVEASEIRATL